MTELQTTDPADTRRRLRDAMQGRDLAGVVANLSPDVVLHSPILGGAPFEGRKAVGDLLGAVMTGFEELTYTAEAGDGDVQMVAFHARVRGREIDAVDVFRMNEAGLVTDITVHIRPMAGLASVAAALGPQLARGPLQRVLLVAFAVPLAFVMGLLEPLVPRLLRLR